MNKKIGLIVTVGAGILTLPLTISCGKSIEEKFAEVAPPSKEWIAHQKAFHKDSGILGDCEQIGFALPSGSKYFSYECEFKDGAAMWSVENIVDLGDCKTGNRWTLSMSTASTEYGITPILPDAEPCLAITPEFFNEVRKKISQKARDEQAVIDSIAEREHFMQDSLAIQKAFEEAIAKDPAPAMMELEAEAKKWIDEIKTNKEHTRFVSAYKIPESQFFTYSSRMTNANPGNRITWTATSKMKMADCPTKSVWKLERVLLDWVSAGNTIPKCAAAITPEVIKNHLWEDGGSDAGSDL